MAESDLDEILERVVDAAGRIADGPLDVDSLYPSFMSWRVAIEEALTQAHNRNTSRQRGEPEHTAALAGRIDAMIRTAALATCAAWAIARSGELDNIAHHRNTTQ